MTNEEIVGLMKSQYIRIKKDNPTLKGLLENRKVAIYFERSHNAEVNRYIQKEYKTLLSLLNSCGTAFIYAPFFLKDLDESIEFNFPNCTTSNIDNKLSVDDFYKLIDENLVTPPILNLPMILVSDPENVAGYPANKLGKNKMVLHCYYIENGRDLFYHYQPKEYPRIFMHPSPIRFQKAGDWTKTNKDDGILFRDDDPLANVAPQDRADWSDIEALSYEIQDRIQRLYNMGLNEAFIRQILSLPSPNPSRLLITEEFRLLLPDYNNREIVLNPLPKALYFFYLRHSEGVLFKHLRDHRDEIFDLYSLLSPSENLDRMNQSIDDLVDSTKNSVNVLCSRIKSAFASQFKDDLARQYYITGTAGEPKRIVLDRNLVEDRSVVVMQ